jgi:hypothetical protein
LASLSQTTQPTHNPNDHMRVGGRGSRDYKHGYASVGLDIDTSRVDCKGNCRQSKGLGEKGGNPAYDGVVNLLTDLFEALVVEESGGFARDVD